MSIHGDLLAAQCSQEKCSVAVNSYIQPNQLVSWKANPSHSGQIYKKFEVTQIVPLHICVNRRMSTGFGFWNSARGTDEHKPSSHKSVPASTRAAQASAPCNRCSLQLALNLRRLALGITSVDWPCPHIQIAIRHCYWGCQVAELVVGYLIFLKRQLGGGHCGFWQFR